jgi:MFS family permease
MVGDYFPPATRGRAIAIVSVGTSVGSGIALFFGAILLRWANELQGIMILGRSFAIWQWVFFGCGAPGVLAVVLLLTFRQPSNVNRQDRGATREAKGEGFLAYSKRNLAALLFTQGGYVLFILVLYAVASWTPTMLYRRLQMSPSEAGVLLGAVVVVCAPLGALLGGFLGDRLSKAHLAGRPMMAVYAALAFLVGVVVEMLAKSLPVVTIGMMLVNGSGGLISTSVFATLQDVTPTHARSKMLSIYGVFSNIVGLGLGSPLVAFVEERFLGDPSLLNYAILIVAVPGALFAVASFARALPGYRRMRQELLNAQG